MPTDEERHEVARKLREAASYYESMERDVYFYLVESALGLKPARETAYTPESVRSLADLIEPSCDRDAIVTFAKNLDLLALMVNSQELTNTGQIAGACQNIANGIREAVGA